LRIEPPQQPDYLLLSRNHIDDLSRSAADKLLTDSNEYGLPAERSDVYLFNAASSRRKPPSRAVRWAWRGGLTILLETESGQTDLTAEGEQ